LKLDWPMAGEKKTDANGSYRPLTIVDLETLL
jgi:hypothetical protein